MLHRKNIKIHLHHFIFLIAFLLYLLFKPPEARCQAQSIQQSKFPTPTSRMTLDPLRQQNPTETLPVPIKLSQTPDSRIDFTSQILGDDAWSTNGPYGGGIFYSVEIAPGDSSILYASNYDIGVYKSTDGGRSWSLIEGLENLHVVKVAIDPVNPDVVYAISYFKIYKTTDAGDSWQIVSDDIDAPQFSYGLAIDPQNPDIVFATAYDYLYKSTNGGQTWQTVLSGCEYLLNVVISPTNLNVLYAGDRNGVWKSENGGNDWSFSREGLPNSPWIYGLAVDPANPAVVYVGADGLYRSEDGGVNWSRIGLENNKVYWGIGIDPTNSNRLVVGSSKNLFISTNRGASWNQMTNGLPNTGIYNLKINPQNSQSIFLATGGAGIFSSLDGGTHWSESPVNSRNRIYQIAVSSGDDIFAATSSGGLFKSEDKGNTWQPQNGNLPSYSGRNVVLDPVNPKTAYYVAGAQIYKSTDGGESWELRQNGLANNTYIYNLTISSSDPNTLLAGASNGLYRSQNAGETWQLIGFSGKFISTAVQISPNSSEILYVSIGGEGIYRSANAGATWQLIGSELPYTYIPQIAIAPANPYILYVPIYEYGIYKSTDHGESWTYAGLGGLYTNRIAMDPVNSNLIYCGCRDNNDFSGGVFFSLNGGQNWSQMGHNLASTDVTELLLDPQNANQLFIGTANYGVWDYHIQNHPPSVEILLPETDIFESGAPITFSGYAADVETGDLPDSRLAWTSDIQGFLGTGRTITVDSLVSGKHQITFSGTDLAGAENQAQREISILPEGVKLIAILEAESDMTPLAVDFEPDAMIGMRLYSAGSLLSNEPIEFPGRRKYLFNIVARGWEFQGWPLCELRAGDNILAIEIEIDTHEYKDFPVAAIVDSGQFPVEIIFTNDYYVQNQGDRNFALDKIVITAPLPPAHDLAIQSILSPGNTINPLAETTPKVEIVNFAQNPETNVPVTCVIEKMVGTTPNEVYRNRQTLSEIAGFAVDTVAFKNFQPAADGTYWFTFFHEMPDADPSNDSLWIETRTALFFDATQQANVSDIGPGFGVAVGDYDNDGFLDIYHTRSNENVLFHNCQDGTFENLAAEAGLEDLGRVSRSAGWFDFDNDNDLDLLILNQEGIALYRNTNGRFSNISWAAGGFGNETNVSGLGIGDYNNDGFLDFYATRYGEGCYFFSNNRNGTFSDITDQTALRNYNSSSSSAVFFDFDQDGDQDLLVSSHSHDQRLFRNNGDTTFTNVAEQVGIHGGGNAHHVMVFDYNNDGWLDVYFVCGLEAMPANILFRNNEGTFTDVSEAAGINDRGDGRGGATGDFDADGFLDIYVVNNDGPNVMYHNNGDGTFTNISEQAGVNNPNRGIGTAVADFDADGDLDIYLVNNEQPNVLYYNSGTPNNWLHVKTTGVISNRDGIGARIEVYANEMKMMRQIDGSPGFGSQSSFVAEFGVGPATQIDRLVIYWPSGVIQDTTNLAVNQFVTLREPVQEHDFGIVSILAPGAKTTAGVPIYSKIRINNYGRMTETSVTVSLAVDSAGVTVFRDNQIVPELGAMKETEVTFAGYTPPGQAELWFSFSCNLPGDENTKNDSLSTRVLVSGLPYFLNVAAALDMDSRRSSHGAAFADYDHDGDFDLYVANCDVNILYKNNGDGTFSDATNTAWVADEGCATGCVWADYNNDGFPDIYISNINQANTLYAYLRDGHFANRTSRAQVGDTGPSWGVAFCDYDRDGFLDLFVAHDDDQTANVLYQNNGDATFTNVAAAAGVNFTGFNSGAAFGDYDNDGDPDLYVANRTGRSLLYRNNGDGTFTNVAVTAKVAESGNAHGVAWGDYDNDGWLDLFVTTAATGDIQSLYHNEKNGTFRRVSESAGLGRTGNTCRSVVWLDYDYDGWLDLYLANEKTDILYRNNGNGTFSEISSQAGIQDQIDSWDVAFADYDLDGDLDIFIPNNGSNIFYQHQGTPNNWLIVKPVGFISNHDGVGARITAISHSFSQIREVTAGSGLGSQSMLPVAFGLARDPVVDTLIVRWPSGIVQYVTDIPVNQYITIEEDTLLAVVENKKQPDSRNLPLEFTLNQNYPNPFNPETQIHYQLPVAAHVSLRIFNLLGQVMKQLVNVRQESGTYSVTWDGTDNSGEMVTSGVYLCQIQADGFVEMRKMVLVR